MRGTTGNRARLAVLGLSISLACLMSPKLWAKFDNTSAGELPDSNLFGGLSAAEIDQLNQAKMRNAYLQAVYTRITKFNEGNKSSGVGGAGRYSNFGEAHIEYVDAMVSHDGGANALESAMEMGALGTLGLSGKSRADKMEAVVKNDCPPPSANGVGSGQSTCTNKFTGKAQLENHDISAAMVDMGPAHGADNQENKSTGRKEDEHHRVYGLRPELITAVQANGSKYADAIIRDATQPGKQMNMDLGHLAYSQLEAHKYITIASDAFALKAARLQGSDTSRTQERTAAGEYKQMAIDVYADPKFKGKTQAAEAEIEKRLGERVAEKKVLNGTSLCALQSLKQNCDSTQPGQQTIEDPDKLATEILKATGGSTNNAVAKAALIDKLGGVDSKGKLLSPQTLAGALGRLELSALSGAIDTSNLNSLYAEAKSSLNADQQKNLAEYKQRIDQNHCLQFRTFCYSTGRWDPPKQPANNALSGGQQKPPDPEFKPVTGDPGAYFHDTREMIYGNFAYSYNRPLAEWKNNVTMADFNGKNDKNYQEFVQLHDAAMAAAEKVRSTDDVVIEAYRSAGATPEQLAKMNKNYSAGPNAIDPNSQSVMKIFGQDVKRDAVAMQWRVRNPNDPGLDPNSKPTGKLPAPPTGPSFPGNPAQGPPASGKSNVLPSALQMP